MKRRNLKTGAFLGALAALCLTACSQTKVETASSAAETTSSEAVQAAEGASTAGQLESGPVTLRFAWWGNDDRHERTLKVIDMYQQAHPNVTIEAEYRGKSEREWWQQSWEAEHPPTSSS